MPESIPPQTTAADLIAQLQKLPPDTKISADIGNFDWDTTHTIELEECCPGEYRITGKAGWEYGL